MSYLPGVPDVGPAPVSPTGGQGGGIRVSPGSAKGHADKVFAKSDGKGAKAEHLASPHARSTITGGDPLARLMGHYGKATPAPLQAMGLGLGSGAQPTMHPGATLVRGGKGQMRTHIFQGGLGPGRMGQPGNSTNYSMAKPDSE